MANLTVLFFSRNDTEKAVELIKDIDPIADEIVVVDQSGKEKKAILETFKKKSRMAKLKMYDAPALGYPEPLQMYAFLKCSNEWVLRIDTDERISEPLKRDIKKIISTTKSDGFSIKRYEDASLSNRGKVFTWQTRIFKRSKTTYTGILHEQPQVAGNLARLEDDSQYMLHVAELMSRGSNTNSTMYNAVHEIDYRLSYDLYNRKMMEYLAKFIVADPDTAARTTLGRLLNGWMRSYETLLFRRRDSEISNFDYFVYAASTSLGFYLLNREFRNMLNSFRAGAAVANMISAWKRKPDSRTYFEISKIINKMGIIRFLGLDDPAVVDALTDRYKDKQQGIQLLISLLKEKYLETTASPDASPESMTQPAPVEE
jgi:hypothetical protein